MRLKSEYGGYELEIDKNYVRVFRVEGNDHVCNIDREKVELALSSDGSHIGNIAAIKQDMSHLAKGHIELKAAIEAVVTSSNKEREYLKGCYSEDMKRLEDRLKIGDAIARETANNAFELASQVRKELDEMPGGYRNSKDIERLTKRVAELEALLQSGKNVTVHSRLHNVEQRVETQYIDQNKIFDRLVKLEECCKNTVASGKALEDKVNNLDRKYGETLKFVRDTTGNLREKVRDILKSL